MNKPKSQIFLFIIFLLFFSCAQKTEKLLIENSAMCKTFVFSSQKAAGITVEYNLKDSNKELTFAGEKPYFEFVIENKLITSNDKLWKFIGSTRRKMQNGGNEHRLVFEGVKNPVKNLQVVIYQQIFPKSTFIREKMELKTSSGRFAMNKLDKQLHFVFPAYSIQNKNQKSVYSTEIRIAGFEKKTISFGKRKKGNHMYYPEIVTSELNKKQTIKGPLSILTNGEISWLTAYEHASQDDLNGMFDKQKLGNGNLINDAMQGTKGVFDFPISADDFKFLGITSTLGKNSFSVSVDAIRGAYLDGEIIDAQHPYATVWTGTGFYRGTGLSEGEAMIRHYLYKQICEKPASRKPEFYYNTWGLQRNDKSKPLRGILTYKRIFEEIDYAAQLGVDIFVLDDGWQQTQGIWTPNTERLPNGLAPIKKHLDKYGIKLGLWYSPMGIDSTTQRYKNHPEWVIKDSRNNPIMAQWNHPAFDFVSGFFDVFIDDCKTMIDQGCRFMKWDAINTFYSTLPNLAHGSEKYSKEEIRARYEYLLPIYVVRAMEILTDYESELIIEVDLTEARRVMVGLAPLSQGKLFWMNNGASWYNDYTTFRTKSMRTIANEFAGLIPLELFTYANYPQNLTGNMKYNVYNSLLAGHGFWGNLKLMSEKERLWVGKQVAISKKVLPLMVDVNPVVSGNVGDSPEIYSVVNTSKAAGQIFIFTEEPTDTVLNIPINSKNLLAVLNNTYNVEKEQIKTRVSLGENELAKAVFILPNQETGVSIVSSTNEINNAKIENGALIYQKVGAGTQKIKWAKKMGAPVVKNKNGIEINLKEDTGYYLLTVKSNSFISELEISSNKHSD